VTLAVYQMIYALRPECFCLISCLVFASEKRDKHQHFLILSSWPNLLLNHLVILTSSCY